MKDLDLLVLADINSPGCRAYLSYLNASGYKPRKILLINFISKSKKFDLINYFLGRFLTNWLVRLYRKIVNFYRSKFSARANWISLAKSINLQFDHSVSFFGRFNYSDYTHEVESIVINGFDDPKLIRAVEESGIKTLLFTGGGLVKPELLTLDDTKVIHIHPGIVPDIKGADGIFWSVLLRGKLGYSGFYMNPGIDTGDILIKREYDLPCFDKIHNMSTYSLDEMYKSILFVFDAHMRAKTLIQLLEMADRAGCSLGELSVDSQNEDEGRTYFFMHPVLRNTALKAIFKL